MTDYPRRPIGCPDCDSQDVTWPIGGAAREVHREVHRAWHDVMRALGIQAAVEWLNRRLS